MSHLDQKQEDTLEVTEAKRVVTRKLFSTPREQELIKLLEQVLDDRSNMVAALYEFRDSATDVLHISRMEYQSGKMQAALDALDRSITDAERALFICPKGK